MLDENKFQELRDDLAHDTITLLNKEAYWGHMMVSIQKTIDPRLRAAAAIQVGTFALLRVHPKFYFEKERRHRVGILKHEILHLVLKHPIRMAQFLSQAKANVAADIAINPMIGKGDLPPTALFPELFDLPENLTLEQYYDSIPEPRKGSRKDDGRNPYIPDGYELMDEHEGWESLIEEGDEGIAEIIIDELIRSAQRSAGEIPGYIKDMISYRKKAVVPWQTVLRRFIGTSRAAISWTKKRTSKRYDTRPGIKFDLSATVLFGIDSSGSISQLELSVFMTELLVASKTGIDLWAAVCDAAITAIYHPIRKVTEVSGRGGTSFVPVFEWAMDHSKHPQLDGIVYLTDGYDGGEIETHPRPSIPTLWVCTSDGRFPAPWGARLRLPELFVERYQKENPGTLKRYSP